jgi:hypothetical protein
MATVHTKHTKDVPKEKKTFTLSPELVAFLEARRDKLRASSVSAVLEAILQAARREEERVTLENAVAGYYDSLSAEEIDERKKWGEFALGQFPSEIA